MRFQSIYGLGNRLFCKMCNSILQSSPSRPTNNLRRLMSSSDKFKNDDVLLFFNEEVQTILKNLAGYDINKVFQTKKLGYWLQPPQYKFMTTEQVDEAFEKAQRKANKLLQMPPFVPISKETDVVLSREPELIALDESKFVITDISFGKTDRTRTIVVRDLDGSLRKARRAERRNANQTYFPRPGRQFRVPKMFEPEYLKAVLERGDYLFVLDRACVEFDADEPEYHRITHATFDHIDEKQAYGTLRFTRHFGPMVFYLTLSNNIDNLLLENLKTARLDDAAALVQLYHIVHPKAKSAGSKLQPGQEIAFIKEYIDHDSKLKVALELALMENKNKELPEMQTSLSN